MYLVEFLCGMIIGGCCRHLYDRHGRNLQVSIASDLSSCRTDNFLLDQMRKISELFLSAHLYCSTTLHLMLKGSGKGTQATYLKEDFGVSSISTGQILRNAVAERTPVGQQVDKIMSTGGLVGDDIMLDLVRKTLTEHKNQKKGWILDGYPRTLNQAVQLSDLLVSIEQPLSLVFYLKVSENTIYERIKDRWIHLPSGRDYNLVYKPPKVPFKDDITGEPLIQRPDDTLEAIRLRLKHYHESTLPILQHFEKQSLLRTVEAPTSKEGYVYIKKYVTDFLDSQRL